MVRGLGLSGCMGVRRCKVMEDLVLCVISKE